MPKVPETMPTKTIAMPQLLEAIKELSVKFHFDEMDARDHLGLPVEVSPKQQKEARALAQRLRAELAADASKKPPLKKDPPKKDPPKKAPPKKAGAVRGPSGYNNFVKSMATQVKIRLNSKLNTGEKLARNAVMSEVGTLWKSLSPKEQEKWKSKTT